MRTVALAATLVIAGSLHAAKISFVSPLQGAQAIGPLAIEVSVDGAVDRVDFFVDGVLAGVARSAPYRIAFDFGTSLDARTITARGWTNGFSAAHEASIATAAMTANETLNVDLVEIPLRVRSSRTLTAADLRVRENGVEQQIRTIHRERPAAHFAFVVDRSLSMDGGKLGAALRAIGSEMRQLRPGDSASLVLFNHNVANARPIAFGDDFADLLADVVPAGGTSLRDALASVASADRTYAIVITDGGDRNSALSDEVALQRISGSRTIVNALVMGNAHARFLDRAAHNTGGAVVAASASSVERALATLLADINSRYLVSYQSNATDRGWRNLDVRARRRGIDVMSARRGYYAE